MLNINLIKKTIFQIPCISKLISIEEESDLSISGQISVLFEGLEEELYFDFKIFLQYPLKRYGSESIKFINKELLEFNHVMRDGSICIHTIHHTDIKQKLLADFNSLKLWIEKYYINKNRDNNYEHIIISESLVKNKYFSYIFTDLDYTFKKGDMGEVEISYLNNNIYKRKNIENYIVQGFSISSEKKVTCKWSKSYSNFPLCNNGYYIFLENPPTVHKRFAFQYWNEFEKDFPIEFIDFIYRFEKANKQTHKGNLIPIFIGYKTLEPEIHWQIAMLEIGKFPIYGIPEKIDGVKTGKWLGKLHHEEIKWAISRDSSYKYFFGRGSLNFKITESKILIIGIGAVGSMIAKSLTKGGCKYIDIADYDIKEPENVCRSEYVFLNGIVDKVEELKKVLFADSPFLEIRVFKNEYFEDLIKGFYDKDFNFKDAISSELNKYDIIFDCTTDDDLMHVLNFLKLKCDLINLSITNHAKDLICAFYPNIYHFVRTQFDSILENDSEDLYEPLGCWSPTFKASYSDINLLVQIAVKQINYLYEEEKQKNNFVVKTDIKNTLSIKIDEY